MIRSLYTAASGMMAQQTNVDTIANNLANVNTIGYKSQSTEFKSLLYQDIQAKTTSANGENKPVGAQVGLGARVESITSHYTGGSLNASESNTDFAIDGNGFFAVQNTDGEIYYTRNGNFYFSTGAEGTMLCTSDGFPVVNSDGAAIVLDPQYTASKITINADGEICYPDETNNAASIGMSIGVFQFPNPAGLEKLGSSFLRETEASGTPLNEAYDDIGAKSKIKQGYLEGSNVNVATEMVNLITAQRAYELCSKAITTSDTMLEQANNLKR